MRADFLPFSKPCITEEAIAQVGAVLRSGWITTGPKSAEFENRFCQETGCGGAVALSSATAGMHLLLKALEIGPGAEVITPSMTWVSTVNLIVLAGATPVFVDVDRATLMVSPEAIAEKVTDQTRLIVPVHFAGAPVDLDPIRDMARSRGAASPWWKTPRTRWARLTRAIGSAAKALPFFRFIRLRTSRPVKAACSARTTRTGWTG